MVSFKSDFFVNNRRNLAQKLHNGIIVMAGHRQMQRRGDVAYRFEQDANFWYLTGLNQPRLQVIYDGQRDYCWIVVPEVGQVEQIFDGAVDTELIRSHSGADEVVAESQIEDVLRQLARRHSTVYTVNQPAVSSSVVSSPASRELSQRLGRIFNSVQSCHTEMASLRSIKQPLEVKVLQEAVDLTAKAFDEVKQTIEQYSYEYQLEAEFTYRFNQKNARHAYEPIVASGNNACTLHYADNHMKLKKGNFVLIDIGAQVDGYAADITRTYGLGKLTKRRTDIHESLQTAHQAIIDSMAPNMPVIEYQKTVDQLIGKALIEVGLSSDGRIDDVRRYMPHAVSHGLGLEVHDSLAGTKLLRPGMVLTVEPGIYIPEESIGIRIEDDILITDSGIRNLSAKLSTSW